MNILNRAVSVFFALAFLGALGIGAYYAIEQIAALFLGMDPQVATITGVASGVVLLAALLVASSARQASKQNRTNQLHADKAATYKLFIDTWIGLLRERAGRMSHSPAPLPDVLQTLHQSLALYGSPAVIKAHAALLAQLTESDLLGPEIWSQFAKALLEMRKNLGSGSRGLTGDHVLNLLVRNGGGDILIMAASAAFASPASVARKSGAKTASNAVCPLQPAEWRPALSGT